MLPRALEMIAREYRAISMRRTVVIACQHVLSTHVVMFDYFHYRHDLHRQLTHVLGKAYSTSTVAFNQFKNRQINIDEGSFKHDSHKAFDDVFSEVSKDYYERCLNHVLHHDIDTVVILDDGGFLLAQAEPIPGLHVFGVEQTTSGYERLQRQQPKIPIYNVARSDAKLKHESPMIALQTVNKLRYTERLLPGEDIVIIGGGAVGSAIINNLPSYNKDKTRVYDLGTDRPTESLHSALAESSVIIGATGTTSVPRALHPYIKDGAKLVSVSSSDREFDAHTIRRRFPPSDNIHEEYTGKFTLINGGYPVNFDGKPINVSLNNIQLTLGLLYGSICYGHKTRPQNPGLIDVPEELQEMVVDGWLSRDNDDHYRGGV